MQQLDAFLLARRAMDEQVPEISRPFGPLQRLPDGICVSDAQGVGHIHDEAGMRAVQVVATAI
ncbi:hypothetical protein D3C85_1940500 [compost metagenome]